MMQTQVQGLESALGHRFARPELLRQALTHSSHASENADSSAHNEQMEFLGDSVLAFVTSQELYSRFPGSREGQLSKLRAHLVSARHLLRVASHLDLGRYLLLGRGEEKTGGRTKSTLLVDTLEAILAAVFLDAGLETVRGIILRLVLDPELQRLASSGEGTATSDYKSLLQERLQAAGRPAPDYAVLSSHGPEHRKLFVVEARVLETDGSLRHAARGSGSTKKLAQQMAARKALAYLDAHPAENP